MVLERREFPQAQRRRFSVLAREAIEALIPEARDHRARWFVGVNHTSACWPARGGWRHVALERNPQSLSGEYGESDLSANLEELASLPGEVHGTPIGFRVELEQLLSGPLPDWRAEDEESLLTRMAWIVTQLVTRGPGWLKRHSAVR